MATALELIDKYNRTTAKGKIVDEQTLTQEPEGWRKSIVQTHYLPIKINQAQRNEIKYEYNPNLKFWEEQLTKGKAQYEKESASTFLDKMKDPSKIEKTDFVKKYEKMKENYDKYNVQVDEKGEITLSDYQINNLISTFNSGTTELTKEQLVAQPFSKKTKDRIINELDYDLKNKASQVLKNISDGVYWSNSSGFVWDKLESDVALNKLNDSPYWQKLVDDAAKTFVKTKTPSKEDKTVAAILAPAYGMAVTGQAVEEGYVAGDYNLIIGDKVGKLITLNKITEAQEYLKKHPFKTDSYSKQGKAMPGWYEAIYGASNLIGQMKRQILNPLTAITTFAGAAIGAFGGPAGIVTGAKLGLTAGNIESARSSETGFAFASMIEAGIDPDSAAAIAQGVGVLNAGLEMVQFNKILKAFGGGKVVNKTVKETLLSYLSVVLENTVQEVAQEAVTLSGENIGRLINGIDVDKLDTVTRRLFSTAKSSLISFAIVNIPSTTIQMTKVVPANERIAPVNAEGKVVYSTKQAVEFVTEAKQLVDAIKTQKELDATKALILTSLSNVDMEYKYIKQVNTLLDTAKIEESMTDYVVTEKENIPETVPTDIEQINKEIDSITEEMTAERPFDAELNQSLFEKLNLLKEQREQILQKLNEDSKLAELNKLQEEITLTESIPLEKMTEQDDIQLLDRVDSVDKLTKEIEKDKKIKVISNKQMINRQQKELFNTAQFIVDAINTRETDTTKQVSIVRELTSEQKQIEDVGKIFGKQIIFVQGTRTSGMVFPTNPGLLFIDINAQNKLIKGRNTNATMLYVVGHELFHSLKTMYVDTYSTFISYIKNEITLDQIVSFMSKYDPTDSQQLLESLKIDGQFNLDEIRKNAIYKTQNQALEAISEEMVANEFGGILTDKQYLTKMQQTNVSLFNKIVTALRELFKSIEGSIYESSLTQLQVANIREQFEITVKTIEEAAKEKETKQTSQKQEPPSVVKENVKKETAIVREVNKEEVKETPEAIKDRLLNKEVLKYNKDEQTAITDWVSFESYSINDSLRRDIALNESQKSMKKHLISVLDSLPNKEGTFNRSIDLKGKAFDDFLAERPEGAVITEKQFISASDKIIYDDTMPIQVKIIAKTAKDTTSLMKKDESEILFKPNTKFKITSVVRTGDKVKMVWEEVSQNSVSDPTLKVTKEITPDTLQKRYDYIVKTFARYTAEKNTENKKLLKQAAVRAYELYRQDGGATVNKEIEDLSLIKKQEETTTFKENMKALMNVKMLPADSPLKESKFYSNTMQNSMLFDDIREQAKTNLVLRNYIATTNNRDMQEAITRIKEDAGRAQTEFLSKDRLTSVDIAVGKVLLSYYKSKKDIANQVAISIRIRKEATMSGQVVQSISILKEMSPSAIVASVQFDLDRAFEELSGQRRDTTIHNWLQTHDNLKLTTAEEAWVYMMSEKADKYAVDSIEYKTIYAQIQKFIADKIPQTFATKLKTFRRIAMLFNAKTMARNMIGNQIMVIPNVAADVSGSVIDKYLSKITGIRTTGVTNIAASLQGRKAGIAAIRKDKQLGIRTGRTDAFEIQQGNVFDSKTYVGRIANWLHEQTNYLLERGDRPIEEMYYNNSIENQKLLNNTTEVTETMKQLAEDEALKRTWKNRGSMVEAAAKVRNTLNMIGFKNGRLGIVRDSSVDFGVGDIILPFIMTPANLLVATYDYSPAATISVIKRISEFKEAVKTNNNIAEAQHNLAQTVGRVTVGFVLYAVGYALAKKGAITGGEDEDKDVRALMKAQGYQPYSIKIGDMTFSYDWAQPLANPFATMAELQRQKSMLTPDKKLNFAKSVAEAFTIGGDRLYEQSFLQSIKTLFSSETIGEGVIDVGMEIPNSFIPTLLKQFTDALDPSVKATYNSKNPLYSMLAKTMVKIPGLKQLLPTKKNVLGQDIEMYGGYNTPGSYVLVPTASFLSPFNISMDKAGEIGREIMDVYGHTGESSAIPQVAPYYVDYNNQRYDFNPEQQSYLQGLMGDVITTAFDDLLISDTYYQATYEQKASALKALMEYSKGKALEDSGLIPDYQSSNSNYKSIRDYTEMGLKISDALIYDSVISGIKSLKDEEGITIEGSKQGSQAYEILQLLTDDNSKNIMLDLITDSKKGPETVESLSKLKSKQDLIDYYSLSKTDTFIIDRFSRDDYDKATTYFEIDGSSFMKYVQNVQNIKTTETQTKKEQVFSYINSQPYSRYQKIFLYSVAGYSIKAYKNEMFAYINRLDITAEQKKKLWSDLGF